jgi:hypothetical protein
VAEGDRHAIRRVLGPRRLAKPKQLLRHVADLVLRGAAGADDRILHLGRRILGDVEAAQRRGQENGAPGVTQNHRGPRVLSEEYALDRHRCGRVTVEQLIHPLEDLTESKGKSETGRGSNHAALDQSRPFTIDLLDDPVPCRRGAGIDPKDYQVLVSLRARRKDQASIRLASSISALV